MGGGISWQTVWKDFKRLIIPYWVTVFVVMLIMTGYMLFKNPSELTDKINSEIIAAIWGSGYKHKAHIWGNFPVVGAIWFLPALFYCRSVFSFAYRIVNKLEISPFRRITYLGITSIIISISFTLLDNFVVYLPGSANSGLSAIIFMFIGYSCNHFRRILHNRRILYLAVGIIIINLPVGGFGMANCFYMCYPLNVLGAAATTAILYLLCKYIMKVMPVSSVLGWCGRCSLLILCVHSTFLSTRSIYPFFSEGLIDILFCIIYSFLFAWLLSKIKVVKVIFKV